MVNIILGTLSTTVAWLVTVGILAYIYSIRENRHTKET